MMRVLYAAFAIFGIAAAGFIGFRYWQFTQLWPKASHETVQLTPDKRRLLQRLLIETKFQPHEFRPLGYTGAANPADRATATAAVNGVIESLLRRADGPLPARLVADLIGTNMRAVRMLDTDDRDRTIGYMLEVWYLLGFKGATGRFAYGAGFPIPAGYGEPLPPGWTAPDAPRTIP